MSLGSSNQQPHLRGSHSDFRLSNEWVTKEESGFVDLDIETLKNDIATDLRKIGSKYDKLVLKMFSQRSDVRNDILLLKKEAKVLRNEMKFLIMKHDNSTAFKKGYLSESHETERVVKAEVVTKEMGQLEVAFADLMGKYYYLLEQAKTLKEINSLWHIRSVMKSDILRKNAISESNRPCTMQVKKQSFVTSKETEEIKSENSKLVQKVRWLTKLSHEFRADLTDLLSAKVALLNGKASLQKQYDALLKESDGQSGSILLTSDEDFRQAEIRIIDGLNRRVAALDRISDALKAAIIKVSIEGLKKDSLKGKEDDDQLHLETISCFDGRVASKKQSKNATAIHDVMQCTTNQHGSIETAKSIKIEGEVEEVQARFVRLEDIDEKDLQCLSPKSRRHFTLFSENGMLYGDLKKYSELSDARRQDGDVPADDKETETCDEPMTVESRSNEGSVTPSFFSRPDECIIERTDSDITLTEEINVHDDEINEKRTEMQNKQTEDASTEKRPQGLFNEASTANCDAFPVDGTGNESKIHSDQKIEEKTSNSNFADIADSYVIISEKYNTVADGNENIVTGFETWEQRFSKAKNFFEKHCQPEVLPDKGPSFDGGSAMDGKPTSIQTEDEKISCIAEQKEIQESELKRINQTIRDVEEEQIASTIQANQKKTVNPDDRPVFYDPNGVWKNTVSTSRASSRTGTYGSLKRRPKAKSNLNPNRDSKDFTSQTLPRSFNRAQKQNGSSTTTKPKLRQKSCPKDANSEEGSCNTLPRNTRIQKREGNSGMIKTMAPPSRPVSQVVRRQSFSDRSVKNKENSNKDRTVNLKELPNKTVANAAEESALPSQINIAKQTTRPATQLIRRQSLNAKSGRTKENKNTDCTAHIKEVSSETVASAADESALPSQMNITKQTSRPATQLIRQQNLNVQSDLSYENNNTDNAGNVMAISSETGNSSVESALLNQAAPANQTLEANTLGYSKNEETSEKISSTLPRKLISVPDPKTTHASNVGREDSYFAEKYQISDHPKFNTLPRNTKHGSACKDVDVFNNNNEFSDSTLKKNKKKLVVRRRKPKKEPSQEISEDKKTMNKVGMITGKAANWMQSALRFVSADSKGNGKHFSKNEQEKEARSRPVSMAFQDFKRPVSSLAGKGESTDHRKSMIPVPAVF